MVLLCTTAAVPCPSLSASSHILNTHCCCLGFVMAGLRKWNPSRYSSLPPPPPTVSVELGSNVCDLRRSDHITAALASLHWLSAPECIDFKLCVLTYRVIHEMAPPYLSPLVCVTDLSSRRSLRSACTSQLVVPRVHLSTTGSRAFTVAAPHVWFLLMSRLHRLCPSFTITLKLTYLLDPTELTVHHHHSNTFSGPSSSFYFRPL